MLTALFHASVVVSTLAMAGPESAPSPRVTVVTPSGAEALPELGPSVVAALEERGLTATPMQLGRRTSEACRDSMLVDGCIDALRRGWKARAPSLMVLGAVRPADGVARVRMMVVQRDEAEPIAEFDATFVDGDDVLPIVFPVAVAAAVEQHLAPPAPPTPEELRQLSTLDEPPAVPTSTRAPSMTLSDEGEPPGPSPVTRSELGEPSPRLEPVVAAMHDQGVEPDLDLRRDFQQLCRKGRRRPRTLGDDSRDLRPRCGLGPVLGYVRPRTWVVTTLAVASAVASGVAFSMESRGSLSERGRREARGWGTATAATAGVMGVGTVILTIGDRSEARRYLRDERWFASR